jgi:Ca2+-binding EF-hand superfamily protein
MPPSTQNEEEWTKETQKAIENAFKLFDKEKKGVVVQEEVPTIMRFLGVYPSEKMLVNDILPSMQGDEPTAFVTYAKLEEIMLQLMFHKVCEPDPEDILLQAFKTLDTENKGYIEWDKMREILQKEGEAPFRDKEIEGFQRIAMDLDTGYVFYEDYVAALRDNH